MKMILFAGKTGVLSDNPWGHGLIPESQIVLENFVEYAHEHGYIPYRIKA